MKTCLICELSKTETRFSKLKTGRGAASVVQSVPARIPPGTSRRKNSGTAQTQLCRVAGRHEEAVDGVRGVRNPGHDKRQGPT